MLAVRKNRWSPQGVPELLWYIDAAELGSITKDGSNLVSAWNNLALPNYGDLVQATSGSMPTWGPTLVGGGPGVETNPASSRMLASFAHAGPNALLVMVFSVLSDSASNGIGLSFAATGVASSGAGGLQIRRDTTLEQVDVSTDTVSFGDQTVTYDTPFILSTHIQGGVGGSAWKNGGNPLTLARASMTVKFDLLALGTGITSAGAHGSVRAHLKLRAAMLLSSIATDLRQKAEGYAAWLPGMTPITLAAGHPYLGSPP